MRWQPDMDVLRFACWAIVTSQVRREAVERRALGERLGCPVAVFEADRLRALFDWSMRGLA